MKYKIQFSPDLVTVAFDGPIDESVGAALAEIRSQVRTNALLFDLEKVDHINSVGIATWIAHVRAFDGVRLELTRLPYNFVNLCEIIPGLLGHRKVHSLQVRYHCARCEDGQVQYSFLERRDALVGNHPTTKVCRRCDGQMEIDDHDLDYLGIFDAA